MKSDVNIEQIVELAISGREDCKEQLVKLTTPKIRSYIFRSTLDNHVTDDLLQEVYCKMFCSLSKLKNTSSFWPWLYKISTNCITEHYRTNTKRRNHITLQDELLESIVNKEYSVEAQLMSKELGRAVMEAVGTLKPRHRQIVTCRCFEEMSFKDISKIEQISEVYARVLFYRAIEKLRLAMKKQGFKTASIVLALTMFGKLTATTTATALATTVKISSISAGIGKIALGAKAIKTVGTISAHQVKAAVTTATVATLITTAVTVGTFRGDVKSVHYVIQGVSPVVEQKVEEKQPIKRTKKKSSSSSSSSSSSLPSFSAGSDRATINYQTKGAYENKLFMPEGYGGPLLRFMQRWNTGQTGKLCSWLQDGSGNYYYSSRENRIYITNDPLRMLILPTDDPEFIKFIFSQVGYDSRMSYNRKFLSGLVKFTVDNRVTKYPDYKCKYSYNSLQKEDLSTNWTTTQNIVDKRDQMHKRGWTCFEITGNINDKKVTGKGRMPFVYDKYWEQLPWIELQVGKDYYVDYPDNIAQSQNSNGMQAFKNEAFFEGFCRPWSGIPCVDSIRRDAAKYRIRFTTKESGENAIITLNTKTAKIIYDIDREADIIRSIKFQRGDKIFGELNFNYIQNTPKYKKFTEPQAPVSEGNGLKIENLWLTMLTS